MNEKRSFTGVNRAGSSMDLCADTWLPVRDDGDGGGADE